jgi:hypothetical protein
VEGEHFPAEPIPPFMQDMISSGGLIPWAKLRLQEDSGWSLKRSPATTKTPALAASSRRKGRV